MSPKTPQDSKNFIDGKGGARSSNVVSAVFRKIGAVSRKVSDILGGIPVSEPLPKIDPAHPALAAFPDCVSIGEPVNDGFRLLYSSLHPRNGVMWHPEKGILNVSLREGERLDWIGDLESDGYRIIQCTNSGDVFPYQLLLKEGSLKPVRMPEKWLAAKITAPEDEMLGKRTIYFSSVSKRGKWLWSEAWGFELTW